MYDNSGNVQITVKIEPGLPGDALVVGLPEGRPEADERLAAIDRRCAGLIAAALRSGDFRGRPKQTLVIRPATSDSPRRVVLTGLGKLEEYGDETVRRGLAAAFASLAKLEAVSADVDLPTFARGNVSGPRAAELAAETAFMALWRHTRYRSELKDDEIVKLKHINLACPDDADFPQVKAAAERGAIQGHGTVYARNLVAEPGNVLTPQVLAREAVRLAGQFGFASQVLDAEQLARLGMNAHLAVGAGSAHPPCLILIDTDPESDQRPIALVGKGLTFDSGGISIKPAKDMDELKYDMAGAAAVLAAVASLGRLGFEHRVLAVVPAAENLPGPSAQRPGDVWRTFLGKTVEVVNTDAEGRLVLADALAYTVSEYAPRLIVDLATLTGACIIALGHQVAGLFGNDDSLCGAISEAGLQTWERAWRLPLFEEYSEQIESDIADLKNSGGSPAGSATAAAFLRNFVGDTAWAHLDIAGTAWMPEERDYTPKGPTGFGARLLVEALTRHVRL